MVTYFIFVTPWTIAHQTTLSMGFSRQEYRNGLPFSSPEDLLNPGIESRSPALQAELPGKPLVIIQCYFVLCSDCSSLQLAPVALWHSHDCMFLKNSFWSTSLVSSGTKCSMLILYISYHSLSWQIDGESAETVADFILGGLQNYCRWWLQPWN